jgi:hypothetical protein
MFRTTARRLAAAAAATAAIVMIVVVTAMASATPRSDPHHTLYRNFCPLEQADVAAAGAYSPATHSAPRSSRP